MPRLRFIAGGIVVIVIHWFLAGCGNPGYITDTLKLCKKVQSINATNQIAKWATAEIDSHISKEMVRPSNILLTNYPAWIDDLYGKVFQLRVTIHYGLVYTNDCVTIGTPSGRDIKMVFLGSTNLIPTLDNQLFYIVKCEPGIYLAHTRGDLETAR